MEPGGFFTEYTDDVERTRHDRTHVRKSNKISHKEKMESSVTVSFWDLGPTSRLTYLTISAFISLVIIYLILLIMESVLRSGRIPLPPLPRKLPPPPLTCEDVGMHTTEECPAGYPCITEDTCTPTGRRDCFAVSGESAPIVVSRVTTDRDDKAAEWLAAHNRRREAFNTARGKRVQPLEWSPELASAAKLWTQKCLDTGRLARPSLPEDVAVYDHNRDCVGACGMNLHASKNKDSDVEDTMRAWYGRECRMYTGEVKPATENYAQIVGRNVKRVGCASVDASPIVVNGEEFSSGGITVCQYDSRPDTTELPSPGDCVGIQGTISGVASEGLARAYRADASKAARRTGGDGDMYR